MIVMRADDDEAARLQPPIDAPYHIHPALLRETQCGAERERVLVRCAEKRNSGCLETVHDEGASLLGSGRAGTSSLHVVGGQDPEILQQPGAVDDGTLRRLDRCGEDEQSCNNTRHDWR